MSGDVSPCNGGPEAGNASCVDGHRGPRCEVCVEPQYYFDVWSATCLPCGSVAVSLAKIAALVLFLALLVGVTSWIISSNWVPKRRLARDVVHFVRKYALLWRQSGMTGKMKIIIAMVQCIWAVPYVYDMDIPEQFDSLLSLFGWITALSPDIFLPGACYGSYLVRLTVSSTWPIVVLALIALKNIVQEGAARRKVAGTTSLREESANEGVTGAVGAPSPPPSPPPLPPPLLPPPPPPPPPLLLLLLPLWLLRLNQDSMRFRHRFWVHVFERLHISPWLRLCMQGAHAPSAVFGPQFFPKHPWWE